MQSRSGVEVFVLDSGVNTRHKDFEGRAKTTANFINHEDVIDLGGHGTHVAGKIAGKEHGVAKSASIHSIKILNRFGDGTMGNLIKGNIYIFIAMREKMTIPTIIYVQYFGILYRTFTCDSSGYTRQSPS